MSSTITATELAADLDTFWLLFGAILVFFMQTGFAMLEVGSVSVKNTKNILIKNIFDASFGAIIWWVVGYGVAFGVDGDQDFIGRDKFALVVESGSANYAEWLFQWAFAATSATIVSGAVAERVTFTAYVIYSVILTAFIYPVIVKWVWGAGWASAFREDDLLFDCGVTDFAGSGVVHMTGGLAALIGCIMIGPRANRFEGDIVNELPQQSPVFQTLGTLILWFGWYGFNGVSTLYIVGLSQVAAKTMVTTTIAAASSAITTVAIGRFRTGVIDAGYANNGILSGLVAITAPCSTCSPDGAFVIGIIAGILYYLSSNALIYFRIDDVVDAVPVHFVNGAWGVVAAGLFATESGYKRAYYADRADECCGGFYGCGAKMWGANIVFIFAHWAWVGTLSVLMFLFVKATVGIRVAADVEEIGMDASKHGGHVHSGHHHTNHGMRHHHGGSHMGSQMVPHHHNEI